MKNFCIFLLVLGFAQAQVINQVSQTNELTSFPTTNHVINGRTLTETEHFSAPSLALIDSSGTQICGLTAITQYVAIGAAHCFFLPNSFYRVVANSVTIGLGKLSNSAQVVNITRAETHPNYVWSIQGQPNDIAIVFFDQALQSVQPALLATNNYLVELFESNAVLQLEGLGDTVIHQPWEAAVKALPDTFQHIFLPLVSNEMCAWYYPNVFTDNFCAGYDKQVGMGTCQGDSGSGLYQEVLLNVNGENHVYRVLVGTVSYARGCGLAPTVFTNLSYHQDFINQHVPTAHWYDNPVQE